MEDPAPQILVKQLNFTAVQLELRGWVKTSEFWDVQWKVNEQIKRRIESGQITPPLLRKEIYVKNTQGESIKNDVELSDE